MLSEYGIELKLKLSKYDAVVCAVTQDQFNLMEFGGVKELCKADSFIYDLKYFFPKDFVDLRL